VPPGTGYVVLARVGVWLLGGGPFPGSDGRLGFVAAPRRRRSPLAVGGSVFFEVRFRGRGPHGCVLLIEIYHLSSRI